MENKKEILSRIKDAREQTIRDLTEYTRKKRGNVSVKCTYVCKGGENVKVSNMRYNKTDGLYFVYTENGVKSKASADDFNMDELELIREGL